MLAQGSGLVDGVDGVDGVEKVEGVDKVGGVTFVEKPIAEIQSQSKAEGKMVFVDCYTSWCGPCKKMASDVFPVKAVGDFMNPLYVSTKIDMEKGEGVALNKKWDIGAYPTFIILDGDGNVKYRLVGYFPAETLVDTLKYMNQHAGPSAAQRRYDAGERTSAVVSEIVKELARNRENARMTALVNDFLGNNKESLLSDTLAWKLFAAHVNDPHTEVFLWAYDRRQQLESIYGAKATERLEYVWSSFAKNFYVNISSTSTGYDAAKMDEYEAFMKSHGVERAAEYTMKYKLPVSPGMNDIEIFISNLEKSAPMKIISNSQWNFFAKKLRETTTDKKILKRLEKVQKLRPQN